MCQKVKGCNRQIDSCLQEELRHLQALSYSNQVFISSCCGHGIYQKTAVLRDKITNKCYEFYSRVQLHDYDPRKDKRHNTYYKKDKEGIYFIPELLRIFKSYKLV